MDLTRFYVSIESDFSRKSVFSEIQSFKKYRIFQLFSKIQSFKNTVFSKSIFFEKSVFMIFLASNVHKRFQETKADRREKAYGQFHDCHSKYLEDIGFRNHIEKTFIPLTHCFDKVAVAVDGDCTFNKILRETNVPANLFLNFDLAHLKKNTQNTVENILIRHKHNGDSNGKIGNENKFRLCSYAKNTMVKVTKIHSENEDKDIAANLATDAWTTMKSHCLGVHDQCEEDGENCGEEPVFRTYGDKFTQTQLDDLIIDIFDNYLQSEETTTKLANCGNTSNLESYHSIFTNRDLWPKIGSLHVSTPKFEGIVAVASSLYNHGDRKTIEKMMKIVDWTVIEGNLSTIHSEENARDKRRDTKRKQKAINYKNRVKMQKQFQTSTKYRKLNPYIPSSQSTRHIAGIAKPKQTKSVQRKKPISRQSKK